MRWRMAGSSASDLEEFDDEYDSYSESVRQDGFLDELLERYTFTYDPAYCLKLRKRCSCQNRLRFG